MVTIDWSPTPPAFTEMKSRLVEAISRSGRQATLVFGPFGSGKVTAATEACVSAFGSASYVNASVLDETAVDGFPCPDGTFAGASAVWSAETPLVVDDVDRIDSVFLREKVLARVQEMLGRGRVVVLCATSGAPEDFLPLVGSTVEFS